MNKDSNATKITKLLIIEGKSLSSPEISKKLGIELKQIYPYMRHLVVQGSIRKKKVKQTNYYSVEPHSINYLTQKMEKLENENKLNSDTDIYEQ